MGKFVITIEDSEAGTLIDIDETLPAPDSGVELTPAEAFGIALTSLAFAMLDAAGADQTIIDKDGKPVLSSHPVI